MERRLTRLGFWIKFLSSRVKKKNEFSRSYEILLTALGGNRSSPTCNGNKNVKFSGNKSIAIFFFKYFDCRNIENPWGL